jgi:membrane protein DedA with SNARE-associated domain
MDPADSLQFFEDYGVVILPALVVAEQIGIPLPAVPALLAVGALAAHGRISILAVLGAISVVALTVDFVWYPVRAAQLPVVAGNKSPGSAQSSAV